ncbi:MAG TPA: hypothetical protein PKY99_13550 [Turneriella sp.]|nr:hypothetical protein [Turneriella sp.]
MYEKFIFSAEDQAVLFPKIVGAARSFCNSLQRTTSIMADERRLRIEFYREEYYFYFQLITEPWIIDESRDLARVHPLRQESTWLKNCAYRVEFSGDEDANMDYFDAQLDLLRCVLAIPGVAVYDYKQSAFFEVP